MKRILLYITLPFILAGCIEEDEFANTPRGNFEALVALATMGEERSANMVLETTLRQNP